MWAPRPGEERFGVVVYIIVDPLGSKNSRDR